MGSLAGGRGWGSSNAEESVVDPEEESVEESLDNSSLEDSPGSLFLFWGGGLGALLGSRLGGRWGLGLGSGAVWGAGRGFEGWGCTVWNVAGPMATDPAQLPSIALAVPKVARHIAQLRMQTQHMVAPGDSTFQFWQPAMSTCALQSAHEKKRDCLLFPPVSLKLTVAALHNSSSKSISWEAA